MAITKLITRQYRRTAVRPRVNATGKRNACKLIWSVQPRRVNWISKYHHSLQCKCISQQPAMQILHLTEANYYTYTKGRELAARPSTSNHIKNQIDKSAWCAWGELIIMRGPLWGGQLGSGAYSKWLSCPIQEPIQVQWWSKRLTHLEQSWQCRLRSSCHAPQNSHHLPGLGPSHHENCLWTSELRFLEKPRLMNCHASNTCFQEFSTFWHKVHMAKKCRLIGALRICLMDCLKYRCSSSNIPVVFPNSYGWIGLGRPPLYTCSYVFHSIRCACTAVHSSSFVCVP